MRRPTILLMLAAAVWTVTAAYGQPSLATLPNGVRLITHREPDASVVAICLFVRAGVAEEAGHPGLAALTARALFGDNLNLSRDAVDRGLWMVGGHLESRCEPDYTMFRCLTTREAFPNAFYIMAQALKGAQFDEPTLVRARREVLADLDRRARDPFGAAYDGIRPLLTTDSPYAAPPGSSSDRLRRLTAASVASFYNRYYTPGRTVIAVVGDIEPDAARKVVENQLLPDFDRPEPRPRWTPSPPSAGPESRVTVAAPTPSALVMAGFRAPGLREADYPALEVLAALVGGGKGSRLFRALRDEAGLGYAVWAQVQPMADSSHLLAWVQYDPSRAGADGKPITGSIVETRLLDAVKSVLTNPPTARELERARSYAIGTQALAHQRTADRAFLLGWYETVGPGMRFDTDLPVRMAAVSADDVLRVARQCLGHPAIAIVEPQK